MSDNAVVLEQVTAMIPTERVNTLRELAKADQRSLSWMVRRAVEAYIDAEQKKAAA